LNISKTQQKQRTVAMQTLDITDNSSSRSIGISITTKIQDEEADMYWQQVSECVVPNCISTYIQAIQYSLPYNVVEDNFHSKTNGKMIRI